MDIIEQETSSRSNYVKILLSRAHSLRVNY